jgi:hypothetical protein
MYVDHWQPVFNYHRRQSSRAYAKANKIIPEKDENMSTPSSQTRKKKNSDDGHTPGSSSNKKTKQKSRKTVKFTLVADLSSGFHKNITSDD